MKGNDNSSHSLASLCTHFEGFLLTQKCVALNTYLAYKQDITRFIRFLETVFPELVIQSPRTPATCADITQVSMVAYLEFLQNQHCSSRTISRNIAAIRLFLKYVHEHHQIPVTLDIILPKVSFKLPLFCTEQEIEQLLLVTVADSSALGRRNQLMVYILYCTGIRVSELISICKSDIQHDTAQLHIRGKGGKARIIPLIDSLLNMIKQYIAEVLPQLISTKKAPSDHLFSIVYNRTIRPISRQAVWRIIKELAKQTTISKDISAHTLRHSLATHNLKNGWDLRSLQLLLGHENISTVEIYTHVETSHLRKTYNKKHPRS